MKDEPVMVYKNHFVGLLVYLMFAYILEYLILLSIFWSKITWNTQISYMNFLQLLIQDCHKCLINYTTRYCDAWGCGVIAPQIFYLGTRGRWVVIFMLQPPYPVEKQPLIPIGHELEWTSGLIWTWWWRK